MYTPRFSPEQDVAASGWLSSSLTSFNGKAGDLTTRQFEAHVRIFHRPDQGMPAPDCQPTWADVARLRGTRLHPAAQWDFLAGFDPASSGIGGDRSIDRTPLKGTLDARTLSLLLAVLEPHTGAPDVLWLALWHGTGKQASAWMSTPTFRLPGRGYWLFRGKLASVVDHASEFEYAGYEEQATRPGVARGLLVAAPRPPTKDDELAWLRSHREAGWVQSPHLWWPQDRAWIVASEVDYDSTIVAGSQALAESLLEHPEIDCLQVSPDTSLYFDADVVNRQETSS